MSQTRPLIDPVELQPANRDPSSEDDAPETPPRRFYHYIPLCLMVFLMLLPHPSLLRVLVFHYLQALQKPLSFAVHLFFTYLLTSLAFCSLIVVIARDPGPVTLDEARDDTAGENREVGLAEALMEPDFLSPGRWCRKCWAPKPERTHHCSQCGRCVLRMDHHCIWMASKCIGHRTYPAFIHFLACITLLAMYIGAISVSALLFAFNNPTSIDEVTPIHELFLSFAGIIFSIIMGSFLLYHIYLVTTNQTTVESLSPFMLLRYLPPLPEQSTRRTLSDPPQEHELSYSQRRLVKDAQRHIRLYDVGWRQNWAQVFGWKAKWGWVYRLTCGGGCKGNGRTFVRNPQAEDMLTRLATEIIGVDKDL